MTSMDGSDTINKNVSKFWFEEWCESLGARLQAFPLTLGKKVLGLIASSSKAEEAHFKNVSV